MAQTNKYLHHLAFTRFLWISLVQDLWNRGFIDRLSAADIRVLPVQALVQVVRQLVVGPAAWSPPRIERPKSLQPSALPKISDPQGIPEPLVQSLPKAPCARIVLHPSIPSAPTPGPVHTQILRGGKYVLFSYLSEPVLGCWRVADDSLLGTYHSSLSSTYNIRDFATEVLPGGERVNIVMRIKSWVTQNLSLVEVISWDLGTGITELLSRTEYTNSRLHPQFLRVICGGFAAVRMFGLPQGEICIIIDFRTQKCCKMDFPSHIG
ncbi:hypothetical protein C8R44DRAFT_202522 [Mycena epipterygia]|nr:hypothetical protein C8R44DRAFT_202522 [Mycena epipterygia]